MSRLRVVLADDHRIVAEGLKLLLEPEFELVDIVDDGRALLDAVETFKPDLALVDISMPELNGIDALEELKARHANVRVVILTMHRNVAYARRALDAGALGYVLKHAAAAEVVLALRAAAAGKSFVSPEITDELLQSLRSGEQAHASPADKLTLRQREILRFLAEGCSAKVIARHLDISSRTVEFHKYKMMEAIGVATSAELIRFAIRNDLAN